MPGEHEKATGSPPDAETTAILDSSASAPLRGGYGDRFEEDAFDYPSLSPSHAWSAGETPAGSPEAAGPEPEASKTRGSRRGRSRDEGGWQRAAVRPRPALLVAAALVLLAGFGLALSTVSETVSSDPGPGGTAPVYAPKAPALPPRAPALPPDATVPAEPPGDAAGTSARPTRASPSPSSDDHRDDEHEQEDPGHEDDDRPDD